MEDSRWPKKIYQRTPHGRRRRGIQNDDEKAKFRLHEKQKSGISYFRIDGC